MPVVKTKTTFLQMFTPVTAAVSVPRNDVTVLRTDQPTVEFYRHLYRQVGSEWNWVDRLVMPPDELKAIIQDERVDLWVLHLESTPVGYAELDRRIPSEIELVYFGLFPEVIGQGLGKYFLNYALRWAWEQQPRRVWLHTCDLDHPAALPNYLKAGFQIYDEVTMDQWIPSTTTFSDGACKEPEA